MTTTTHRRGDRRADGFLFWSYEKTATGFREKWKSPAGFAKCAAHPWKPRPTQDRGLREIKSTTATHFVLSCGHTQPHRREDFRFGLPRQKTTRCFSCLP
jgi:hypothetical protein